MKRAVWTLGLALIALMLGGCSAKNVEAQAYAVSLGMDLAENGGIRVSVQVPTLNQGSAGAESEEEDPGGGGGKGYTFSEAAGTTLTEALEMLNASVPRELNLTGVKSIIVSEQLARSGRFVEVLQELALAYRVYGAAEMAVCRGDASEFIQDQQPVIGLRLSESTSVALEHYQEYGYVPSAKAADIYYLSRSFYGDPVAILAAGSPEKQIESSGSGLESYAGTMQGNGNDRNQFFGTALLSGGRMVGMLNGTQTQLLNVLMGNLNYFSWIVEKTPVRINLSAGPEISVDLSGEVPVIDVKLSFNMMDSEGKLSEEALKQQLTNGFKELTRHCQACGCDPFRYAEAAVGKFQTAEDWLAYDWRDRFPNAQINYEVNVRRIEL